jgi:hypothetical protein
MSGSWMVVRDDEPLVRQVVKVDHYLRRWPDARSLPFGYRLKPHPSSERGEYAEDGRPWGVVVFKKPQHHRQRGVFGYTGLPTAWQVLDLARVWVHPALQSKFEGHNRKGESVRQSLNVFSQMVGLCIRRVQWDWLVHHPPRFPEQPYQIALIISYCDLNHHEGVAYRASGFEWVGKSRDLTKEVYARWLKPPKKRWQMPGDVQPGLPGFDMPIRYFV